MEGSISCVAFFFTISIALTSAIQDQLFCCGYEFIALNLSSQRCEIGRHLWLPCDELSSVPYLEVNESNFTTKDERKYFKVNVSHSGLLSPFCLAHTIINGTVDENLSVIFCKDEHSTSRRHQQLKFHQDIIDSLDFRNLEINLGSLTCLVSGVLLAIVAVVYVGRPTTQDIEEKCIFHVALNQSLFYFGSALASVVLSTGYVEPYLGNYCAIFWYLFVFVVLSSFIWCAILTYHLRKTFRENIRMNEFKRLCLYVIVGYGIPVLLIAFCVIHVHANSYFRQDVLELTCNAQFDLMSSYYGILPLIIISLINSYLLLNLERYMMNVPSGLPEYSVTSIERFKFRLSVNKKLFILLIAPWLVIAFLGLPMAVFESLLEKEESTLAGYLGNIIHGIYFLLCSDGIIMFYMLIISHRNI